MFNLTGILKNFGIGGSVATAIATFAWTYLGGVKAVEYGWITIAALLKKAAISAGVAGLAGVVITAVLAIGLVVFKKKLKLGKSKFIAW